MRPAAELNSELSAVSDPRRMRVKSEQKTTLNTIAQTGTWSLGCTAPRLGSASPKPHSLFRGERAAFASECKDRPRALRVSVPSPLSTHGELAFEDGHELRVEDDHAQADHAGARAQRVVQEVEVRHAGVGSAAWSAQCTHPVSVVAMARRSTPQKRIETEVAVALGREQPCLWNSLTSRAR